MVEPIYVHCKGSGLAGHEVTCPPGYMTCVVCGKILLPRAGKAPDHDRKDLIAMMVRGDFDE